MVTESEVSFSVATESECVSSVTPETEWFILFPELRKEVSNSLDLRSGPKFEFPNWLYISSMQGSK